MTLGIDNNGRRGFITLWWQARSPPRKSSSVQLLLLLRHGTISSSGINIPIPIIFFVLVIFFWSDKRRCSEVHFCGWCFDTDLFLDTYTARFSGKTMLYVVFSQEHSSRYWRVHRRGDTMRRDRSLSRGQVTSDSRKIKRTVSWLVSCSSDVDRRDGARNTDITVLFHGHAATSCSITPLFYSTD